MPAISSPVIYHVPHDATVIPADLRDSFLLNDAALQDEILAMTDHWTQDLFSCLGRDNAIVFPVSRLVLDPERFSDDTQEPMARHGMGVLYTQTSFGAPLRHELSPAEREELLARFYHPHHARFAAAVDRSLAAHGYCLILSCHSFPAEARRYELSRGERRPDICLGTDAFHTPGWLLQAARLACENEGYSVSIDTPYAGAIVPLTHFGHDRRVLSLMLEINRRMYMNEQTGERIDAFVSHRAAIARVMQVLADLAEIHLAGTAPSNG